MVLLNSLPVLGADSAAFGTGCTPAGCICCCSTLAFVGGVPVYLLGPTSLEAAAGTLASLGCIGGACVGYMRCCNEGPRQEYTSDASGRGGALPCWPNWFSSDQQKPVIVIQLVRERILLVQPASASASDWCLGHVVVIPIDKTTMATQALIMSRTDASNRYGLTVDDTADEVNDEVLGYLRGLHTDRVIDNNTLTIENRHAGSSAGEGSVWGVIPQKTKRALIVPVNAGKSPYFRS